LVGHQATQPTRRRAGEHPSRLRLPAAAASARRQHTDRHRPPTAPTHGGCGADYGRGQNRHHWAGSPAASFPTGARPSAPSSSPSGWAASGTGETPSSAGPFLPKGDFVTEPRDLTDADRLHISLGQRVRERVAVDRRGAGSVTRAPQGRSAAAAQALPGPRRDGLSSCARILRAPTGKLVPRPGAYRLAPIVPTVPARRDGAPP
jgi:hypothetical protein